MSISLPVADKNVLVDVKRAMESFKRTRVSDGPDPVTGTYSFILDITAVTEDIYLPVSISSGKKPTGFVYQIEGTAPGSIASTDISCRGDGITQTTLGTIFYSKIPAGMTATFRISIHMRGAVGKSYRIVINQLNYKRDPRDTRYQKSVQDIHTKMVKFS